MTSPRSLNILKIQEKTKNFKTEDVAEIIADNIENKTQKNLSRKKLNKDMTEDDLYKEYISENHISNLSYINGFLEIDQMRQEKIKELESKLEETSSQSSKKTRSVEEIREFYKDKTFLNLLNDAKKKYKEISKLSN